MDTIRELQPNFDFGIWQRAVRAATHKETWHLAQRTFRFTDRQTALQNRIVGTKSQNLVSHVTDMKNPIPDELLERLHLDSKKKGWTEYQKLADWLPAKATKEQIGFLLMNCGRKHTDPVLACQGACRRRGSSTCAASAGVAACDAHDGYDGASASPEARSRSLGNRLEPRRA